MRDSLIKILKQTDFDYCEECAIASEDGYKCAPDFSEFFADHLLANGVIVPPCKVGASVYVIASQTSDNRNLYIFEDTITHYRICDGCTIMCLEKHLGVPTWNWDKVFLTKEEAEKALAKMKGGAE